MKKSDLLGEADGRQLAADMLEEINEHWLERCEAVDKVLEHLTDEESDRQVRALSTKRWQEDKSEILRQYLATVSGRKSPALEHGFFSVLTDFIGSNLNGEGLRPDAYAGDADSD